MYKILPLNRMVVNLFKGIDVGEEVRQTFEGVNKNQKFNFEILGSKIQDNNFQEWIKTLSEAEKTTMKNGEALKQFKNYLVSSGQQMSRMQKITTAGKTALAGFGKALISIGATMATTWAVGKVVEGIDNYIHREEIAIEKAEDITSTYNNQKSTIEDNKNVISEIGEEYVRLNQYVSSTGENLGLSAEDFERHAELSNKIANILPELVAGYDSLGNPILSAASSVEELNAALEKQSTLNEDSLLSNATEVLEGFQAKATEKGEYGWETPGTAEQIKIIEDLLHRDFRKYQDTSKANNAYRYVLKESGLQNYLKEQGTFGQAKQYSRTTEEQEFLKSYLQVLKAEQNAENQKPAEIASILLKRNEEYAKLNNDLQNMLSFSVTNYDYAENGLDTKSKISKYIDDISTATFANSKVLTKYYSDLDKLRNDDEISAKQWSENTKNIFEQISKITGIDKESLAKAFGLELNNNGEVLAENGRNITSMVNELNKKFKDTEGYKDVFSDMNIEDLSSAFDIACVSADGFTGSLDQLLKRMKLVQKSSSSLTITDYKTAVDSANAGAAYEAITQGLKDTKKAWDKGLVGTDEFDTFARLIAPEKDIKKGTYIDNYLKNYTRTKQYYTEDNSGPKKLLDSLVKSGNIDRDSKGNYFGIIEDTKKAAENLNISQYAFEQVLQRLKDYGFNITFDSVTESAEQANEEISRLQEVWDKLEEGSTKNALGEDIEDYKQKIIEFQNNSEKVPDHIIKEIEFRVTTAQAKAELEELELLIKNSTGEEKKKYQEQYNAKAEKTIADQKSELGIKSAKNVKNKQLRGKYINQSKAEQEAEQEYTEAVASGSVKKIDEARDNLQKQREALLDVLYEIGLSADQYPEKSVDDTYQKTKNKLESEDKSIQKAVKNLKKTGVTIEQLKKTDFNDGKSSGEYEKAFDNLIRKLGLSSENASTLIELLKELNILEEKTEPKSGSDSKNSSKSKKKSTSKKKESKTPTPKFDSKETTDTYNQMVDDALSGRTAPKTIQIKGDNSDLVQKVDESSKKSEELDGKTSTIKQNADTSNYQAGKEEVLKGQEEISNSNAEPKAKLDDTEFNFSLQNVIKELFNLDKTDAKPKVKLEANGVISTLNTIKTKLNELSGKVVKSFVKIVKKESNVNGSTDKDGVGDGGTTFLHGTAHVKGTIPRIKGFSISDGRIGNAYAKGTWGVKKGGRSLMGELGPEIIVRGGKFFTVGDNGAEFVNTRPNDIIFNHRQSEELLKNGHVTSNGGRGKILGSAFVEGTAYAQTEIEGSFKGGASTSSKSSSSSGSSSSKSKDKNKDKTKKGKTAWEKFEDWLSKLFDWIEVKTSRLERLTSKWMDKAENAIRYMDDGTTKSTKAIDKAFDTRRESLKKAISYNQQNITANQRGTAKYQEMANTVLSKAVKTGKVSKSSVSKIKAKVADGSINISDYKEETQKVITEYQKWYEKALDCKDAVEELREQQKDLYDDLYKIPIDRATAKVEKYQKALDRLSSTLDAISGGSAKDTYISNVESVANSNIAKAKKDYLNKRTDYLVEKEQVEKDLASAKKSVTKDKSLMKNSQVKKAVKNGKKIDTSKIKDKNDKKKAQKYNDALDAKTKLKEKKQAALDAKAVYNATNSYYSEAKKTASSFKDKPEYEYQNYLIEEQLKIQKEIDKQNQTALRTAVNNEAKTAKAKASAVQAKKDATTNLKKSKVYKKLSASQKNAVEKGQTISEKGFSGKNLEEIRKYNKAIQEANKRTDAYNSALNALSEAEMNAAESTAELTKAQIEAEQTKFDNIKSYYDTQKSYQDSLNSQIEAQQSLKEAKGVKLNKSDYEGLIGNSQKQEALAREEVAKLQAQLDSSVKNGIIKEGSSEWIEMQSQINDAKVEIIDAQKAQIEWNNAIVEMELEKFENLLDLLDAISEYNDSLIDLKKATGDVITAEDFNRQIADRQEQIKALEEERSEVWDNYQKALADSEGAYGGKTADEWKQQYYELGTEINNVKQEVIDLQDELNNLELDKLARDLKKLSSAADRLEHSLNIKEAKGLSATVEDYEQLIANSKEQVANLEAQNAELRKQQEGLKEDSDKYQELQDKIEDNEAAIRDAEIAQIEWNNAIAEVPIQELERLLEVLKSIAEYNESIVNLKKASGEVVTEADYRQQIADREQQIAALEKQRAIAYQNYQEALNSEEKAANGKTVEEWEAKYNSLGTEINNVKIEIEDLKDEINSIELTKLSNELAVLSAEAERLNDAISMKEVRGASLNASDYNQLIANSKQQVSNLQAQNAELRRIQSGYEKGSEKYEELQRQIEDNEDAIRDAQRAQEEWDIAIQNLPFEKLERALELLDAIASYNESLNDLKSAQGQDLTTSDYEQQMADNNKKIENLLDQRQEALNNYQQAMNSDDGTYAGKTADEWQAEYNSLGTEINNTKIANEQLKDSMREDIEFRQFKRASAETERLRTQLETLRAVIDDDDMYDDNGNLTSQGHSAIAIAQKELASYQKDIENANAKIARIKAMHGQDGYSEDEYLADLADAENELLAAVQGEANARKEIKSIIQESVDLQLEAAQKLIDKYNDLKNEQKDLYDYQKSIKDLTKEISDLTKQEIMLKGDDSEENKAKVQQIKVSLEEAKENLQETEYEHYISEQQKMLDNLYDEYEESMNESVDRIVDELKAGSTEIKDTIDAGNATTNESINVGNENLSTGILDNTTAITDNTTAITEGNTAISEGLVNVDESINNNFTSLQELLQSLMEGLGFSSDENTDSTNSIIENIANELSSQFGTEFADMNAVIQQLAERFGIDLNASSEEMAAKFKELADQYGINLDTNFEEITAKIKEWAEKYGVDLNVNFDEVISYLKSIAENLKDSGSGSVKLDGYASGTKSVDKDKWAWTQELAGEPIIRASDGALLTPVGKGDVIFTPDMAKKLWEFANGDYTPVILDAIKNPFSNLKFNQGEIQQDVKIEFNLPDVQNVKDFIETLKRSPQFEQLIQSMSVDLLNGGSRLKKYTIK